MASLSFSSTFYNLNRPMLKPVKYLGVRSHSFRDEFQEGKATNNVDANLHVLKQRMDEVRVRERSKTRRYAAGWTYRSCNYPISNKGKRNNSTLLITELLGQMGVTFGFVFLSGSLGICLMSFLVHFLSHLY